MPLPRFRDFVHAPYLAFNRRLVEVARGAVGERRVAFVYQRYSVYNYAGVALARDLHVPFVLEYNGSEVWIEPPLGSHACRTKSWLNASSCLTFKRPTSSWWSAT